MEPTFNPIELLVAKIISATTLTIIIIITPTITTTTTTNILNCQVQ